MTTPDSQAENSNLTSLDQEVMRLFSAQLTEQSVDESAIKMLIESYKEPRTPSGDALLSKFKQAVNTSGSEEGE